MGRFPYLMGNRQPEKPELSTVILSAYYARLVLVWALVPKNKDCGVRVVLRLANA